MGKASRKKRERARDRQRQGIQEALADPGAPDAGGQRRPARRLVWTAALLTVAVTLAVWLPVLGNGFVNWDDPLYTVENGHIRSFAWPSIRWMLGTQGGYWMPVTWLTHALDYHLGRLDARIHHATSLVFHGLNTLLVFFVSLEILRLAGMASRSTPGSLTRLREIGAATLSALLFGVHPLHVETAAWIAERKGVVCALFFLLSLRAYLRYASLPARKLGWLVAGFLFFVLALLSKPMAITLPLLFLILDWWPLDRLRGNLVRTLGEKAPFFAVAAVFAVITVRAQTGVQAVISVDAVPLAFRVMNAGHSIVFYLWKMLVPVSLLPFYPIVHPETSAWTLPHVAAALLVLLVSIACFRWGVGKRAYLSAAWLGYLVILAPVLGIVQVGTQAAADRYTYFASLSPFLLFSAGVAALAFPTAAAARSFGFGRWSAVGLCGVLVAGLPYLTVGQIAIWKDSTTVWEHVTRAYRDTSLIAHTNLANAYRQAGRVDEALREYDRVLAVTRPHAVPHEGKGLALLDKGRVDEAIVELEKAIALNPRSAKTYRHLWLAYDRKGLADEALAAAQTAVAADPEFAEAYSSLGISYGRRGRFEDSERAFAKALALEPGNLQYLANLATTYQRAGKLDEAIDLYRKTRALDPRAPVYAINLGNTYLQKGMVLEAIAEFQRAVELQPTNPVAQRRLAEAHARLGKR